MKKDYRQKPIDILKERCDLIDDLIIKYKGYIVLLRKGRGTSSEPADVDLIDFKDEINYSIDKIIERIDNRLRSISNKKPIHRFAKLERNAIFFDPNHPGLSYETGEREIPCIISWHRQGYI